MHQPPSVLRIYHSDKWLTLPYIGSLLYLLQIIFLRVGFCSLVVICHRDNQWQKKLLSFIPKNAILYCRSATLGRTLVNFQREIVFDDPSIKASAMTTAELYALMWTLLYCASMTRSAKETLSDFVYDDFPTVEDIEL